MGTGNFALAALGIRHTAVETECVAFLSLLILFIIDNDRRTENSEAEIKTPFRFVIGNEI